MFDRITNYHDDAIEAVYARAAADSRPDKLNLGIGVYRDAVGAVTVMQAVREAEQHLLQRPRPKAYLSPLGNADYVALMQRLILGEHHAVLRDARLVAAQGPGAGGMLRVAAELIRSLAPNSTVWVSDPVWEHQIDFFASAGLRIASYPYYDRNGTSLRFDDLLETLSRIEPDDTVLLHGCCHNPTGADLSLEQWRRLTDLLIARRALPLVDVAYQGFGDGVDADVAGLRLMADSVDRMVIVVSSSKSFTVYRDRVGMLGLVLRQGDDRASVERYLRDRIRSNYFMPPDHGAAIVAEILSDPSLLLLWRNELDSFRTRIVMTRGALHRAMRERLPLTDWNFILHQKGMFSCMPLQASQLSRLERDHGIYLLRNGRLNFAALATPHVDRVAKALTDVLAKD